MNRRTFFRIGGAAAVALPEFHNLLAEQQPAEDRRPGISPIDRAPDLVRRALSSRISGLPTVEPVFGGMFLPGGESTQLIT
jgi:hypothetical protein